MTQLSRYVVNASFGTSYVIAGETELGTWTAVIMALNKNCRAIHYIVHGDTEPAMLANCEEWIRRNVEQNAQMIPDE